MILLFKLLRKTSKGNWLKPLMFASIATLSFYILQGQPQNLSDNQFNMIFAFIALYSGVLLSLYNHISSWLNNFSLRIDDQGCNNLSIGFYRNFIKSYSP